MVASLVVTVKASQSESDYKDGEHFKQASNCFVPETAVNLKISVEKFLKNLPRFKYTAQYKHNKYYFFRVPVY